MNRVGCSPELVSQGLLTHCVLFELPLLAQLTWALRHSAKLFTFVFQIAQRSSGIVLYLTTSMYYRPYCLVDQILAVLRESWNSFGCLFRPVFRAGVRVPTCISTYESIHTGLEIWKMGKFTYPKKYSRRKNNSLSESNPYLLFLGIAYLFKRKPFWKVDISVE